MTELVVLSDAICYPDNSGSFQVEVPVMPLGSCGFSSCFYLVLMPTAGVPTAGLYKNTWQMLTSDDEKR